MRTEGNLVEAVPEGYEIYERPGGRVSVRKIQKTPILPHELQYIHDQLVPHNDREYAFFRSALGESAFILSSVKRLMLERHRFRWQAEIRGKEIIIYEVSCDGRPMMKFTLCDEEEREYQAYRWCFRGRIDGWLELRAGQLSDLAAKYCPALGTDNFYELW
jgi:hypothetical protein